jgi:hypothetical protein
MTIARRVSVPSRSPPRHRYRETGSSCLACRRARPFRLPRWRPRPARPIPDTQERSSNPRAIVTRRAGRRRGARTAPDHRRYARRRGMRTSTPRKREDQRAYGQRTTPESGYRKRPLRVTLRQAGVLRPPRAPGRAHVQDTLASVRATVRQQKDAETSALRNLPSCVMAFAIAGQSMM